MEGFDPPPYPQKLRDLERENGKFFTGVGKALDRAISQIHAAETGERNNTIFFVAQGLGTLVAKGHLNEAHVLEQLLSASASYIEDDGFDAARATIESGIETGKRRLRASSAPLTADAALNPQEQTASNSNTPLFQPAQVHLVDPKRLPPRPWLFGQHYIRGYANATVAPGAVGKTTFTLTEAVSMATGRQLLFDAPRRPLRVWVWNGEDPRVELERRIAAICLAFEISADELNDTEGRRRLYLNSGRDMPISIAERSRSGFEINDAVVDGLMSALGDREIDVLIVDPLISTHRANENDNVEIDTVIKSWSRIADRANVAIELVHHSGKASPHRDQSFEGSSRGASALVGAVRSGRFLSRMTSDEANKFGVGEARSIVYVSRGDKANMSAPEKRRCFELKPVRLGNATDEYPEGDVVAVAFPWEPPDAFDGVPKGTKDAFVALARTEKLRAHHTAQGWAGYTLAALLKLDIGSPGSNKQDRNPDQNRNRAKVLQILKTWVSNEVVVEIEENDPRAGRTYKRFVPHDFNGDADPHPTVDRGPHEHHHTPAFK